MAQMKAYTIPMKNWTQICLTIVFCRHKQVQPDVGLVVLEFMHSIKNAEGKKNFHFRGQISNFLTLF